MLSKFFAQRYFYPVVIAGILILAAANLWLFNIATGADWQVVYLIDGRVMVGRMNTEEGAYQLTDVYLLESPPAQTAQAKNNFRIEGGFNEKYVVLVPLEPDTFSLNADQVKSWNDLPNSSVIVQKIKQIENREDE